MQSGWKFNVIQQKISTDVANEPNCLLTYN